MANLIDSTFFYGKLSVPQLPDTAVINALTLFIDDYEPSLLTNLLGYSLYKLFLAGIAAPSIYKDILDGKEYTNRKGDVTKWLGLKYTVGSLKKSLIANYVYYWYIRNQATNSTSSGEKVTQVENAIDSSPRYKLFTAWNEMVEMNIQLREFLLSNVGIYPEYVDPIPSYVRFIDGTYIGGLKRVTERQNLFLRINPYL